jgi:hypothetical protein
MLRGWRCGARLTASQMRAHFTVGPMRTAGSDDVYRKEKLESQTWTPPGRRTLCGVGAVPDSRRAGTHAHFADTLRLGSRLPAHRAQYARATSRDARSGRQPPAT